MKRFLIVMLTAVALMLAPASVDAAFVGTVETFTIPLGEAGSTSTLTFTMARANIKEVYLWVPTLDSGDTATLAMTYTAFSANADSTIAAATIAPNGWSNKVIGASDDNAIVKVLGSVTSIPVDGPVNFTVTCSSEQEADRVFFIAIIREY